MEYSSSLLEGKLDRVVQIGDDATLAFVTTLLTCGGYVFKKNGYPQGFSEYNTVWGEGRLGEVKEQLKTDGIIQEDENVVALNYPGWQSLSEEQREKINVDLSNYLFGKAKSFFSKTISQVVSNPEGRYILNELVKVGPRISEDIVGHLMTAVGLKYWQQVNDRLVSSGLFVHAWSSKKHDYFRLFPSLTTVGEKLNDALAFVYIAQYARSDGPNRAGVLAADCQQYKDEIGQLIVQGALREQHWVSLLGYVTTVNGSAHAATIIQQRLEQGRDAIKNILADLPLNFLRFLYQEVIETQNTDGRSLQPVVSIGFRDDLLPDSVGNHLCLLNDPRVKKLRDDVLDAIVKIGLATKVHTYVSSHGGRVDGMLYVVTPELSIFLEEYLKSSGLLSIETLFDEHLEHLHRMYHVLADSVNTNWNREAWYVHGEGHGVGRAETKKVLDELIDIGVLKDEVDRLVITNSTAYRQVTSRYFLRPLVEHLLKPIFQKEPDQFEWDVFISHAFEDKETFVRELAHQLVGKQIRVWYDESTLKVGDSLRRSIDRGLTSSRYGIVVLSHNFFAKEWSQKELDGLVSLERNGRKVILPIWLDVDTEDVRHYSSTLADRVAAKTKDGMGKVIRDLLEVLKEKI